MSIREWFKLESNYEETKVNVSVDRMLTLCRGALNKYFSIRKSKDITELVKIAYEENNHESLDETFLKWILEKGLPRLQKINFNKLPDNEQFIAMVEYDEYVLSCEMDFSDPEEVRSCIISFVNSLPEYIASSREVSASYEEDYYPQENKKYDYRVIASYTIEEKALKTSISGSAINADPFFIGGTLYECA